MLKKLEPKTDCFAFPLEGHKDCRALNDMICKHKKCSFYMSKTAYEEKNGKTYDQVLREVDGYSKMYNSIKEG